jgi:hypothetical protein
MQSVQIQKWAGEGSARKFDWVTIPVLDAMKSEGPYRCPECHTSVRLHKASTHHPAHAEHRVGSKTCSLSCYYK